MLRAAKVLVLKNLAKVLSARRDWPRALACWEAAADAAPDDDTALLGRARATLQTGRTEEATARFRELADRHPECAEVLDGLLEALWAANDHAAVAELAPRLWPVRRKSVVARRLVTALTRLRRIDEAERFIRHVDEGGGNPSLLLELQTIRYRDAYEWTRLADLLRAHRRPPGTVGSALAEEVDCLLILGRIEELRQLLTQHPPRESDLMHPGILLATAQAFGRGRVRDMLHPLLSAPKLWSLPHAALPCAVAAAGEDDHPLLAEAFQRIAHDPLRCKDRLLPLMAPFSATLHASLASLRGARPDGPGMQTGDSLEARLQQVLRKTSTAHSGEARLLDYASRFETLRHSGHPLHLHVSSDLRDALAVADAIVDAMEQKRPLSALRLGDGEGAFLPGVGDFSRHRVKDQAHFLGVWWGESNPPEDFAFLEPALLAAVDDADILGIPDLERLTRQFRNLSDERLANPGTSMMRGYVSVLEHALAGATSFPHRVLTSSHFHEAFAAWGLWEPILRRAGSCSLITCHAALAPRMEAKFGVRVRRTHLLPPEVKWSAAFASTGSGRHYPDRFNTLRHSLDVRPGELYLVAAGVLGKIYCQWIKAAGGIAVDAGSVADHWCGHRTRSSISALQALLPATGEALAAQARHYPRIARLFGA